MSGLLDISGAFSALKGSEPAAKSVITPSSIGPELTATNFSGIAMGEQRALTVSAVWACVQLLSQTIGTLPGHVYRRDGRGRTPAPDSPAESLISRAPNALQTYAIFRETMQVRSLLGGNGYSAILRDSHGVPGELWPLTNGWCRVDRRGRSLTYDTYTDEFGQKAFAPRDMLHIPDLVYDGYKGIGPVAAHRQGIGLAKAAEEFGARLFLQGVRASGFIKRGQGSSPSESAEALERYRTAFASLYSGVENAHRVVLLESGDDWIQSTINPNDAQFLETRRFQSADIARVFNIPPAMIGAPSEDSQTYANVEHRMLSYVVFSLLPRLTRWEAEINRKLIDDPATYFKFKVDGLLRGDIRSRYLAYGIGRQWGWFSANDVRELEDMNPIEGGDVYLTPSNMEPADAIGDASKADNQDTPSKAVADLRAALFAWDREAA